MSQKGSLAEGWSSSPGYKTLHFPGAVTHLTLMVLHYIPTSKTRVEHVPIFSVEKLKVFQPFEGPQDYMN